MAAAALTTFGSPLDAAAWLHRRGARRLCTDHRQVGPGDAFLAWPGHRHDARHHVGAALQAGAVACLVEARCEANGATDGAANGAAHREAAAAQATMVDSPQAALPDLKRRAGEVADAFLGAPSAALDVLAVTGTNGKTSTTWWLAQALAARGQRCAVVGTLGVGEPGGAAPVATGLTTPDAVALHQAFAAMRDQGVRACAIEASSIGLAEHRLAGVRVAVAAFTNLTRDHLDYHGSMPAYGQAKRALFDAPGLRAAVVNVDDAFGASMLPGLPAVPCWTVSSRPGTAARLRADDIAEGAQGAQGGLAFTLREGELAAPVRTMLVGRFNVDNLLTVAACLRALGHPLPAVATALGALTPVPGRMQRVVVDAGVQALPELVVDYAHTPDALAQALAALAPRAHARGGRLWCVFGCGGERDASKRAPMGAAAAAGAQRVIVTSDNPRGEPPQSIIDQVLAGVPAHALGHTVRAVIDRHAAIAEAVAAADARDVVLVAGKGHETTQEIAGEKRPFSDAEEAMGALRLRAAAQDGSPVASARPVLSRAFTREAQP